MVDKLSVFWDFWCVKQMCEVNIFKVFFNLGNVYQFYYDVVVGIFIQIVIGVVGIFIFVYVWVYFVVVEVIYYEVLVYMQYYFIYGDVDIFVFIGFMYFMQCCQCCCGGGQVRKVIGGIWEGRYWLVNIIVLNQVIIKGLGDSVIGWKIGVFFGVVLIKIGQVSDNQFWVVLLQYFIGNVMMGKGWIFIGFDEDIGGFY